MIVWNQLSLMRKLVFAGAISTGITSAILAGFSLYQASRLKAVAENEAKSLATGIPREVVSGIISMTAAQQEILVQKTNSDLNVAKDIMERFGSVRLSSETVEWEATNQFSKEKQTVKLPKLLIGDISLGMNSDLGTRTPIVDQIHSLIGGTTTIFQRMNEQGDMIRVGTNVETADHKRAIGTYIPVIQPDGTPNPVLAKVLNKERYLGRAFVVNKWYVAGYEPILDHMDQVIGVIYVGIPEESAKSLRDAIMKIKVGDSGYAYVLDEKGNYVISQHGKRDGENLWNAKDSNGVLFIQEIIKKAQTLPPGEFFNYSYPWKNGEDKEARIKTVTVGYFAPWKWIVGAGTWDEELFKTVNYINESNIKGRVLIISGAVVAIIVVSLFWIWLGRSISLPITQTSQYMNDSSQNLNEVSGQLLEASTSLSKATIEQASALEETSASLEEITGMIKNTVDNAKSSLSLASDMESESKQGNETMKGLSESMQKILASNDNIQKLVDMIKVIGDKTSVIDEIVFQTKLLSFNASVEAERAGEHGRGFAVVAQEVGNLAQMSGNAAAEISKIVRESVTSAESITSDNRQKVQDGNSMVAESEKILQELVIKAQSVSNSVSQILTASEEQAHGISQINDAISQLDKGTQQNSKISENASVTATHLQEQAKNLDQMVQQLNHVVLGKS